MLQSSRALAAAGIRLRTTYSGSNRPLFPWESWLLLLSRYDLISDYALEGHIPGGILGAFGFYSPVHYGVNLQNTANVEYNDPLFVYIFRFPRQPNQKGSAEVKLIYTGVVEQQ